MVMTRLRSGAGKRKNYRAMAGVKSRKPRSRPTVNTVKAIVKRAIGRVAENKFCGNETTQAFNYRISSASECYPILPTIGQGTDDYQRVGDSITPKYLTVKGAIQWDSTFLSGAGGSLPEFVPPTTIRVMILSQKNIKTQAQLSSADVAHLLKDNIGIGNARAYSGLSWDNMAPINKDLFKVHMDRKFKMQWQTQSPTTGSSVWSFQTGNNLTRTFSIRIKCPARLTFDDTNGNSPNNFCPFICLGAVADDGSSPFIVDTPIRMKYQSVLYYEDL